MNQGLLFCLALLANPWQGAKAFLSPSYPFKTHCRCTLSATDDRLFLTDEFWNKEFRSDILFNGALEAFEEGGEEALGEQLQKMLCLFKVGDPAALINAKNAFMKKYNLSKEEPPKTIKETLKVISPDNDDELDKKATMKNLQVYLIGKGEGRSYYMPIQSKEGDLSFRHKGDLEKKPSKVFLQDRRAFSRSVLVFYSASGSGKSVELACSGVTRGCDLTIVASFAGDLKYECDDNDSDDRIRKRQEAALKKISGMLSGFFEKNDVRSVFQRLLDVAQFSGEKLRLAFAIDEASRCPELVRAIIRNKKICVTAMAESMKVFDFEWDEIIDDDIPVSIAGTGLARADIASSPDNFRVQTPSHEEGFVRDFAFKWEMDKLASKGLFFFRQAGHTEIDSLNSLKSYLPVVATLMQNGRLSSIAFEMLGKYDKMRPVDERVLVDDIVDKFMMSNGLADLMIRGGKHSRRRHAVAAMALAVHIFFQEDYVVPVPKDPIERDDFFNNMKFYPDLAETNGIELDMVVSKYGLLEPADDFEKSKTELNSPLRMTSAQQLVALHMMDIGIDGLAGLLRHDPYGFEVLSTHLIKSSIAASLALKWNSRPTVRMALERIGFSLEENSSEDTFALWEFMDDVRAVHSTLNDADPDSVLSDRYVASTFPLSAELKIIYKLVGEQNHTFVQTDNILYDEGLQKLERWDPRYENDSNPKRRLAGLAFVNFGSSSLPDGFVIFHVCNKANESESATRFTVMNQAKDYHDSSELKIPKLQKHAERASAAVLDTPLGKRVLAVASCVFKEKTGQRKLERPFLAFNVCKSVILSELMAIMNEQRSGSYRQKEFSTDRFARAVLTQEEEARNEFEKAFGENTPFDVKTLKRLLKDRGLPRSGRKLELAKRLLASVKKSESIAK